MTDRAVIDAVRALPETAAARASREQLEDALRRMVKCSLCGAIGTGSLMREMGLGYVCPCCAEENQ